MSVIENETRIGNSLQSLNAIRDNVKKSLADRMEQSVRKVWEKDNFFRMTFTEDDLLLYLNKAAGENGIFTTTLLREIFGVDNTMPDPKEFPGFCEKCHMKFGMAYRYRLCGNGKPSPHWGGQFVLVLDTRKGNEGKLKIGRFCSECHPKVTLNEKTFWQTYEAACNRLTAIIHRSQEERDKMRREAERKQAAVARKDAEREKLEGGMKTAAELNDLLSEEPADEDRVKIREIIDQHLAEEDEVEELTLADLIPMPGKPRAKRASKARKIKVTA